MITEVFDESERVLALALVCGDYTVAESVGRCLADDPNDADLIGAGGTELLEACIGMGVYLCTSPGHIHNYEELAFEDAIEDKLPLFLNHELRNSRARWPALRALTSLNMRSDPSSPVVLIVAGQLTSSRAIEFWCDNPAVVEPDMSAYATEMIALNLEMGLWSYSLAIAVSLGFTLT